ncbi:hypothetical protein RHSIM_Rhsim13G0171000 [Rhododendron simsii]|uniref:F-box/LRR-repeat protein 15/At3g58940/PEG3-like LRR domain-containing protein n=1 Tax=Rhododendron simsii TaxID=118357 RepID=A0A834L7G8_RHOSS|nr:hypothetical protein RHSIM_Rhsim13G0171000 [Rhododendron simsii]
MSTESDNDSGDGHGRTCRDLSLVDELSRRSEPLLKRRWKRRTTVDRINELTDSLLFHILSFLPIEDAIKTEILVTPKRGVDWNSLKNLSIGHMILSDEVIQKILVGSPVLKILELYYFRGVSHLHFSNASLKMLILREYWDHSNNLDDSELEIFAPNLQSLEMLCV